MKIELILKIIKSTILKVYNIVLWLSALILKYTVINFKIRKQESENLINCVSLNKMQSNCTVHLILRIPFLKIPFEFTE